MASQHAVASLCAQFAPTKPQLAPDQLHASAWSSFSSCHAPAVQNSPLNCRPCADLFNKVGGACSRLGRVSWQVLKLSEPCRLIRCLHVQKQCTLMHPARICIAMRQAKAVPYMLWRGGQHAAAVSPSAARQPCIVRAIDQERVRDQRARPDQRAVQDRCRAIKAVSRDPTSNMT